jgi:hypothetical protein
MNISADLIAQTQQAIIDYNKMEEESEMDDYNNLGND